LTLVGEKVLYSKQQQQHLVYIGKLSAQQQYSTTKLGHLLAQQPENYQTVTSSYIESRHTATSQLQDWATAKHHYRRGQRHKSKRIATAEAARCPRHDS